MFRNWPLGELQNEIGTENLELFEYIIPRVSNDEDFEAFVGNKRKLASLVENLKDHDYFRDKSNLVKYLNYISNEDLYGLYAMLKLDTVSIDRKILAKKILSNANNYQTFIKYFEIDQRFLAEPPVKLPAYFENVPPSPTNPKSISKPYKTLKNYQYQCMSDATALLEHNMSRSLLQMPTGSGKTRTSSEIIAHHLNEVSENPRQVIWLANTRELCEQAIQCMAEVWDHVGLKPCRFNRLWDGNLKKIEDWRDNECAFTVGSLQTLHIILSNQPDYFIDLFRNTTLTVVDEAHIAVAPTYSEVIRNISRISGCKILGLTATPKRNDLESTTALSDLFFNQIASLEDPDKGRNNTIAYLRSLGVMSEAFHQEIQHKPKIQLTDSQRSSISSGNDIPQKVLDQLGANFERTVSIILGLRNLLDQGAKIIYFAPSVQNSFLVSAILNFIDFKSVHISSNTSPRMRDTLIEGFKDDKFQILCNYGVLATGFDAPKIDVVCIGRPTMSPVLYSQMIGRGMRGPKVGGTEQCVILEVTDNFIGLGTQDLLYKQFQEYWAEDVN